MFTRITNSNLFRKLKDKKYRDLFVAGEVRRTVPFQLRALRAERKWTQSEMGKAAEMPQTVISRIENGDATSLNIKTLLKVASALDVALVVRFEPIDRLIDWVDNLGPNVMSPRTSGEILAEMEERAATKARSYGATQTAVSYLRPVESPITTAAIELSLPFSSPIALVVKGGRATTGSQPLSVTETTPSVYRRATA